MFALQVPFLSPTFLHTILSNNYLHSYIIYEGSSDNRAIGKSL